MKSFASEFVEIGARVNRAVPRREVPQKFCRGEDARWSETHRLNGPFIAWRWVAIDDYILGLRIRAANFTAGWAALAEKEQVDILLSINERDNLKWIENT